VERARKAAADLGYRVNRMARGLKMNRSFTIGMLIPDITNPFFPPIVRGAEDALGEAAAGAIGTAHRPGWASGRPALRCLRSRAFAAAA